MDPEEDSPVDCPYCSRSFETPRDLKQHLRRNISCHHRANQIAEVEQENVSLANLSTLQNAQYLANLQAYRQDEFVEALVADPADSSMGPPSETDDDSWEGEPSDPGGSSSSEESEESLHEEHAQFVFDRTPTFEESQINLNPVQKTFLEILVKKLSFADGERLMSCLLDPCFDVHQLPFTTRRQAQKLLLNLGTDWTECDVSKPQDRQSLTCYMLEDRTQLVKDFLGNPEVNFSLDTYQSYDATGERVYTSMHSCTEWEMAAEEIGEEENARILPLGLYSDKAPFGRLGHLQFHIVQAFCPAYGKHDMFCHYKKAMLIPSLRPNKHMKSGSTLFITRRLEVMHECLQLFLQPIKDAAYVGVQCVLRKGCLETEYKIYPWPCMYVCDLEEAYDLACLKGPQSLHPDIYSLIGKTELDNTVLTDADLEGYARDSGELQEVISKAKRILATGKRGAKTLYADMLKPHSAYGVTSALNGIRWSDPLSMITVCDLLHQDRSGIGLEMINAVVERLTDSLLDIVNSRLQELAKLSAVSLCLNVRNIGAGYVTAQQRYQVLCLMPFILVGIFPKDSVILAFSLYVEWQKLRDQAEHTESSLELLAQKRQACQKQILQALYWHNWKRPKFFNMRRYEPWIKRFGYVQQYSAEHGERGNKSVKEGEIQNNKQSGHLRQLTNFMQQVDGLETVSVIDRPLQPDDNRKRQRTKGSGILQLAIASGKFQLTLERNDNKIFYELLHLRSQDAKCRQLLQTRPELVHFAGSFKDYLLEKQYGSLPHQYVYEHSGLGLPCGNAIRVNTQKERFDRVRVEFRTQTDPDKEDEFMEARLIFSCKTANGEDVQGIFGQWFERVSQSDATRCQQLRWEKGVPKVYNKSRVIPPRRYSCVDLDDVVDCRPAIVPNFLKDDYFYLISSD